MSNRLAACDEPVIALGRLGAGERCRHRLVIPRDGRGERGRGSIVDARSWRAAREAAPHRDRLWSRVRDAPMLRYSTTDRACSVQSSPPDDSSLLLAP